MKRFLAALAAFAFGAAARGETPLIPIDSLFGTQYLHHAQLSPDGKKVAFLAPSNGTYSLALLDLETHKVSLLIQAQGDSIQTFFWKGNEHIVFEGDIGGIEQPQVAVTDLEGKRVFSLLRPQKEKLRFSVYSGEVLSQRVNDPDHIYAIGYSLDSDYTDDERTSVYSAPPMVIKIELHNGHRSLVCPANDEDPNASLGGLDVDFAGQVRTAVRTKGENAELLYRDDSNAPWRVIKRSKAVDPAWEVAGFSSENSGVYIFDYETADTGALRVFDPVSETLGPPLFTPKDGEISALVIARKDGRLVGLRYETDKPHTMWFDPKFDGLQKKLDRSFPNYSVSITSFSDDETRFLIRTSSDRDPGTYYVLDTTGKGSLGLVTAVAPKINPALMSPMLPISFTARDGLEIHGYLTLPRGSAPGKPLPLIIHPHGGPFGIRDTWFFDPEVQFLANRGYAVLQINYRGSGGYGRSFLHAGYREWGGKMQDDLSDGVKWAIAKGYADPKRVAIFGASYGGYATLAGLTFTPELYKCGINYVGVSDLVELTRRKGPEESAAMVAFYKSAVGSSNDELYQHSPVNFVERIRVPLLNAYGENDGRVDVAQWVELKSQLEKYHKNYSYMLAKDEGHGFAHAEDAVTFYTKVEAFLKANL